jgi:2-oxoglutarate dehydrogenase E1 component
VVNLLGKIPREVFREFIDHPESQNHGGDVKYHLGYSTDYQIGAGHKVHLSLCFNPSHVEFVSPVALGRVRAKQDRSGDREGERGMALLIHGDASFPGQGVVQEALNLSALAAYTVGGALHVMNLSALAEINDDPLSTTYSGCTPSRTVRWRTIAPSHSGQ